MKVLDFMNTHKEWEELITQPPYNIKVKRDGNYVLLKYNQLSSDFNNEIVRECRGSIFHQNTDGKWICVCRAFDKFGNYGESYVSEIDWTSAVVEEKVDGSLIKLFYHNDNWHISTNGTIDAFKAIIDDTSYDFGMLVYEALGGEEKFVEFTALLDKRCSYMFELVSPKSRVTISYPKTKLYYLGQRSNSLMKEYKNYTNFMQAYGILCPREYDLTSIDECLEYVETMTKDEEGFVIRDKYFNRMKLKSPKYLFAFRMNNNGAITMKRIIDMVKEEKIDDFLAYCPQYTDMVNDVVNKISILVNKFDFAWKAVSVAQNLNRKEFAIFIRDFADKDFLFRKYNDHALKAIDYIMFQRTDKIKEMIEGV